MTDMWDDDDRAVLAHLPFDEVAPPTELEERTMAAALARRPAAGDEVAAARQRRRSRVRLLTAAAAAIVAIVAIGALVATRNPSSSGSPNRIEAVSATGADVQELVDSAGSRTGTFPAGAGQTVLASDGRGDLYDLRSTGPVSVAIETADGTVVLGDATPRNGIIAFHVQHPELVRAMRMTPTTGQALRATLTPR